MVKWRDYKQADRPTGTYAYLSVHCGSTGISQTLRLPSREPVWRSGKALSWQAEGPRFDPLRLFFLFNVSGLWTPSCDFAHTINETLKWLTQLPALMQSHSGGDSVASRC